MNLYHIKMHIKKIKPIRMLYNMAFKSKKIERGYITNYNVLNTSGNTITEEVERILSSSPVTNNKFFLDFGGLLGMIRNGEFIKWDLDIDYGLIIDEAFSWNALEALFNSEGFTKVRQFSFNGTVTEQTYRKGNADVDFFAHYCKDDYSLCYCYYRKDSFIYNNKNEMHVMQFKTTQIKTTTIFKGNSITVHIPNDVEDYLKDIYTEDWRIPNPNWIPGSGPSCEKLSDNKIAHMTVYK